MGYYVNVFVLQMEIKKWEYCTILANFITIFLVVFDKFVTKK